MEVTVSTSHFYDHNFELRDVQISEHERNAVISTLAAREGFDGRWRTDLSLKRCQAGQNPKQHWLDTVHYYWPDE